MMLTWVYQLLSSRTSTDTRGSARMCSSRLRPSSMFTSTRPSAQRYQGAADTGWPSRRSVVMTDGLGLRSMATAASGSGGFDMEPPGRVVCTDSLASCPSSSPRMPHMRRQAPLTHAARPPHPLSLSLSLRRAQGEDGGVNDELDFAAASAIRKVVEDWVVLRDSGRW